MYVCVCIYKSARMSPRPVFLFCNTIPYTLTVSPLSRNTASKRIPSGRPSAPEIQLCLGLGFRATTDRHAWEVWFGNVSGYAGLRVWGSRCLGLKGLAV